VALGWPPGCMIFLIGLVGGFVCVVFFFSFFPFESGPWVQVFTELLHLDGGWEVCLTWAAEFRFQKRLLGILGVYLLSPIMEVVATYFMFCLVLTWFLWFVVKSV